MDFLMMVLSVLMWALGALLAILVGYLVLLSILALRAPAQTKLDALDLLHRFVFLVPAHNEQKLLPTLLSSLAQLDYPASLYRVHVVADNCTDRTAEIARSMNATVHERFNRTQIGKGYALQWLLTRLWQTEEPFEAAIILDADSLVTRNFLRVMNAKMNCQARIVQAYYTTLASQGGWAVGMRAAALAAIHYLRPQGRTVIGASVGLKGNGMLFRREILQQYQWGSSVTEDIEYHMELILAGDRVAFAPDAVVHAEMPDGLGAARTQNARWEQGRIELARRYVPQLLRAAWMGLRKQQAASPLILLDAVMEHLIPPFSMLVGLTFLLLLLSTVVGSMAGALLACMLLVGEIGYLLIALVLARASRDVYLSLLYSPAFLVWKCWLYLRVLLGIDRQNWVRTARISDGD